MALQAMTPDQAAATLGVTAGYLAKLRTRGDGPPFIRLSPKKIVYSQDALEAWALARTHRSTSEPRRAA